MFGLPSKHSDRLPEFILLFITDIFEYYKYTLYNTTLFHNVDNLVFVFSQLSYSIKSYRGGSLWMWHPNGFLRLFMKNCKPMNVAAY